MSWPPEDRRPALGWSHLKDVLALIAAPISMFLLSTGWLIWALMEARWLSLLLFRRHDAFAEIHLLILLAFGVQVLVVYWLFRKANVALRLRPPSMVAWLGNTIAPPAWPLNWVIFAYWVLMIAGSLIGSQLFTRDMTETAVRDVPWGIGGSSWSDWVMTVIARVGVAVFVTQATVTFQVLAVASASPGSRRIDWAEKHRMSIGVVLALVAVLLTL